MLWKMLSVLSISSGNASSVFLCFDMFLTFVDVVMLSFVVTSVWIYSLEFVCLGVF